jgi:hypothetical protein
MAHFAKIENDIVTEVIVAEQDYIDTLEDASQWIQTSYNTKGGVHVLGGEPLRKNYASIGYTYDSERDAFIAPKPYPSWILDEETCIWNAPVPEPARENVYSWNEQNQEWDLVITLEELIEKNK